MQDLEESKLLLSSKLKDQLSSLPNIPHEDVPEDLDENSNIQIKEFGNKTKPSPNHFEIGEEIGMLDFESAVKLSGSRFVVLRDKFALLERALINFMLDTHVNEFKYTEISPPLIVNEDVMFVTHLIRHQECARSQSRYCSCLTFAFFQEVEIALQALE